MSNKQLSWVLASAIAGGLLVLMLLMQLAIHTQSNSLQNVSPECVRSDQCEKIAETRPIAEPENTLSNMAYLAAGIAVFARALRSGIDRRRVPALMVGVSFCFLAICSAYYHATLNDIPAAGRLPQCNPNQTKLPQYLDIIGVYVTLLSMICYGLDRLFRKRVDAFGPLAVLTIVLTMVIALAAWLIPGAAAQPKHWVMTGLAIWLVCGMWAVAAAAMVRGNPAPWVVWTVWSVMLVFNAAFGGAMRISFDFDSDLVFPVLVGLLLAVATMNVVLPSTPSSPPLRLSWGELGLTFSAFTVGMLMRVLDGHQKDGVTPHALCSADSWVQAHAVWHLMSALALLLTFDLIEKSSSSSAHPIEGETGPALLPAAGSVVGWLTRPGEVLGRRLAALMFNIGFSLVALAFGLVLLLHAGAASLAALVPLAAAVYLWLVTYLRVSVPADSRA